MKNNIINIVLWGETVGQMYWDKSTKKAIFQYDDTFIKKGLDIAPITMSTRSPRSINNIPWEGNSEKLFQGLPPMFADSLPDKWGSALFSAWMNEHHINAAQISPVDKLCYIGSRGFGALEFVPAFDFGKEEATNIDLQELLLFAQSVLEQRKEAVISKEKSLLWQDLVKIGTSAGGRRPKAIIAYNEQTGEIRSGQTSAPDGFVHYILKFDEQQSFPFTKIEYVYSQIALQAGIQMMPCQLLHSGVQCHFMTQRFDRCNNEKLHLQTLAAMNPLADSYEDIFIVMRKLGLSNNEFAEQFRRLVFNVIGCNIDDHSKNFSFIMDKTGKWGLSPAYDLTFSKEPSSPSYMNHHDLSINGKTNHILFTDLEKIAKENDIVTYKDIINEVESAFNSFDGLCQSIKVDDKMIALIKDEFVSINP